MKLNELLKQTGLEYRVENACSDSALDIPVKQLAVDSRKKAEDSVFFCIKGMTHDSHLLVDQAIENGALAIVYDHKVDAFRERFSELPFIKVSDSRLALAKMAECLHGNPSSSLKVYGVTGTNGKTSVSYLIYKILSKFEKSAYNGTAGSLIGTEPAAYKHLTTPDTLDLARLFEQVKDACCESIAMEVSSHALDMKRSAGIDFDIAVFTNLSRDHLDYHKTMEAYRDAKAELFRTLKPSGIAVINLDDAEADFFQQSCLNCRIVTYGSAHSASYRFDGIVLKPNGTEFRLTHEGRSYHVGTNLISEINVYNLVAAIAALHQGGKDLDEIIRQVAYIDFNIGRFQYVKSDRYSVIVDFAHTPDAFEKVFAFSDLFRSAGTRVISVFGSAGERDKGKRPIMGRIAEAHSDRIVLTEDDNRSEAVLEIIQDIASGIEDKRKLSIVESRTEAIRKAFALAEEGDLILLLGKAVDRVMYRDGFLEPYEGDDVIAARLANG